MSVAELPSNLRHQSARSLLSRKAVGVKASACLECGTPLAAELVDVARMDLLMLADRPLRYGTALRVALFSDLVSSVAYATVSVHFCRATHEGWQIGGFLSQPLPDILVERFWDNLRGQLRYECDWKGWVLWDKDGLLDAAQLVGYSLSGLRMIVQKPVADGSEFSLFRSSSQSDGGFVRARTEWSRQIGPNEFIVGCFIPSQRGRELPRMFGNLADVHFENFDPSHPSTQRDIGANIFFDGASPEKFLPSKK